MPTALGNAISTGHPQLDAALQGLRWGDNVVFLVEQLADYAALARRFIGSAIQGGQPAAYVRFAPHPPLLAAQAGLDIVTVDPSAGFDLFSAQINHLIEQHGRRVFYAFDSLSALVDRWATDELVANFFQVTCPYLAELETVAYFSLQRGSHANEAVARVVDTTQLLIDTYHVDGHLMVHPIKVSGRYSPRMFLPFRLNPTGSLPAPPETATTEASAVMQPGSTAPWNSVYQRLAETRNQPHLQGTPEIAALRSELRRMLMGDEPTFAALADRYLGVDDLLAIRDRVIGSGRIGGKAAGMLLARRILASGDSERDEPALDDVLDEHDSFYIGSDVFFTFLVANGLFRPRLQVHRQEDYSRGRYEGLVGDFMTGAFPGAILEAFEAMLSHYGENPIIVRSSSFLEDGFGHAFAGKYHSEFIANQGTLDERLEAFCAAVKRVYASALSPDALAYRRRRGLEEPDEQMAVLVQRVSGQRYKRFFLPMLAGVAFSRNIYPWTDRIDPARGMVRLVFGLGTRAVDRVEDYPRMVAISNPELRPESTRQIARYSQRRVDLIDVVANRFVSLPLAQVLADRDLPGLSYLVSEMRDGFAYDPPGNYVQAAPRDLVLTFNGVLRKTNLIPVLEAILARLERAYARPVDVEFTARWDADHCAHVNVLQCRPMAMPGWSSGSVAEEILPESVLFQSDRMAGAGLVSDIRYIIAIDPQAYGALDNTLRYGLGRIVGQLNGHPRLADATLMMMGPGRWGSSNTALGVNVTYADIDRTAVLVEVAREEAGQLPEVSYGTHFFQDLVEDRIIYVPVYPDDPDAHFAHAFFGDAPSVLRALLPSAASYAQVLKVIDVPAAAGGRLAHLAADPAARRAVCYLR